MNAVVKGVGGNLCVAFAVAGLLALAGGPGSQAAAAQGQRQFLHGHLPPIVAHLQPVGRLPAGRRLNLAIGLPLRNRPALTNLLEQLYDPASPLYHHYLTPARFAEQFGPAKPDYQGLLAFVQTNGFTVTATHPNRVLLDVNGTVADIERTFHLVLRVYPHPKENRTFYAPDTEPSVDLSVPLLDISGLNDYLPPQPRIRKGGTSTSGLGLQPRAGSAPGGAYMGNDFRAAYAPGVTLTGAGQVVGLVQFDGYYAGDITAYETQAGLPNVPLQNVLLDGYNGVPTTGANSGSIEVSLDIEMVISMAPGLAKVIVYEAGPRGIPNDVLSRMATDNLAKQLSCSWGWTGGPNGTTDQLFQQMDAQGQSFFCASGDSDAYPAGAIDNPSYPNTPSDNPYITIVGGTTLSTAGAGGAWSSETVWNWGGGIGSSGGYSSYYPIPTWQQAVSMSANQGSTRYRNIPDVALTADNVYVRCNNGSSMVVGGTSCAAPLWAGFAALANQQAALAGQPVVGFLNPALYGLGTGPNYTADFHDTTTGNNTSSSSPGQFYAVAGYDLCTGWGTPHGASLINDLVPVLSGPLLTNAGSALLSESCAPGNGAIDPGETVTVNLALQNLGGANTTNLVATLLAGGGVLAPSGPQAYGVVTSLGAPVSRPFTFTANGPCGGSVAATLQLQDGPASLGTVTFNLPLGQFVPTTTFTENFDGVTAPALPSGWTTATSGAQPLWVTSTAQRDTAPNAAFSSGNRKAGVNELVSPSLAVSSGSARLSFRHSFNLQEGDDGGVLEIKIGAGAFTDILDAGGSFAAGGYTTALSSPANPLNGRQAWTGNSGGFMTTTVNLPAVAAGQSIQLKWRCGTDNRTSSSGWYVDTVSLLDGTYSCCVAGVAPSITTQPVSQTVPAGANATFNVTASSAPPLSYQWTFGGTNLAGATLNSLLLTNVQPQQAGNYAVVVTNVAGSVTSAPALLRVLLPPSITSVSLSGSRVAISFPTLAGLNYTLEYKDALTNGSWTALLPATLGTGSPLTLLDTNALPATRFYRLWCE